MYRKYCLILLNFFALLLVIPLAKDKNDAEALKQPELRLDLLDVESCMAENRGIVEGNSKEMRNSYFVEEKVSTGEIEAGLEEDADDAKMIQYGLSEVGKDRSNYVEIENDTEESICICYQFPKIQGTALTISCNEISRKYSYAVTKEERAMLERIVESEAGGEDLEGKLLVANVILNRVKNKSFPSTVEGVIFQKNDGNYQFSPVRNGRYYSVDVSEESRQAVEKALQGEDDSDGALYFMARKYTPESKTVWFDRNLTRLFAYGGHEFFK